MVSHSFELQVKSQRSPTAPGIGRTAGGWRYALGPPCPRSKTSARAAEARAGDRRRPGPGPAARSENTRPRASPSSVFVPGVAVPTARSPCSPLPRHVARAGPGRGSSLRIYWPPSPPTSILPSKAARARARPSPARSRLGPAGARVRGPPRSWGVRRRRRGEGRAGRTARHSAGERRGLGLRLLRKRQPPGRSRGPELPRRLPA